MSKLLTVSPDGKITIDNEFYLYNEFKVLTKETHKIALYLYLYCNPESEIAKWDEISKKEEALKQSGIKLDDKINKAVEKYKELLRTPALDAIESSLATLHTVNAINRKVNEKLQNKLTENITFEEVSDIQSMIKLVIENINKLPATVETLKKLKDTYRAESQERQLIGNQQEGFAAKLNSR